MVLICQKIWTLYGNTSILYQIKYIYWQINYVLFKVVLDWSFSQHAVYFESGGFCQGSHAVFIRSARENRPLSHRMTSRSTNEKAGFTCCPKQPAKISPILPVWKLCLTMKLQIRRKGVLWPSLVIYSYQITKWQIFLCYVRKRKH